MLVGSHLHEKKQVPLCTNRLMSAPGNIQQIDGKFSLPDFLESGREEKEHFGKRILTKKNLTAHSTLPVKLLV